MKKLLLIIFTLSFSTLAQAETFYLEFGGERLIIQGDLEYSEENSDSVPSTFTLITLRNIDVQIEGIDHKRLYLQARLGWGATLLNPICEALGESLNINVPFANGWGLVKSLPDGFFSSPTYLILDTDGFEISQEPSGSVYYPSINCTSRLMEN